MEIKSNPYLTILSIVFGLLIFFLFIENKYILYLTIILSAFSIFSLSFSKLIENIWFKLSLGLSKIIPNILLTIIYYFLLTPIGIIVKIFNNKNEFIFKNQKNSTFKNQSKSFEKESFKRAW